MSVPKLRFKDYSGNWDRVKLRDIFNISAGGDIKEAHVSKFQTAEFRYPIFANAEKQKGLYGYSNVYKVTSPSLTVAGRGVNIGIAHCREENFYPIVRLLVLKGKNALSYKFFEYQINTINLIKESTGVPQLTAPQISNYYVINPSILEQEKIASFFTVIDQKLNLLKAKKEKLELYKKGVMQQIFSQKLRFKDEKGNVFPEWKKIVLGNILTEVVEKSKVSNQEEVLSSTAKGLFKQSEYFNREIASSDSTGYKVLRKHQLVFSPQNLWLGNINVNLKYEIGIVSPSYKTYEFNSNTTPQYGNYILKLPRMINEYKISSTQGASVVRRNLDMEAFENIPLHLPTLPEQQKIANFLSALDTKINLVSTQIEKTELWKKGLLQQMFV